MKGLIFVGLGVLFYLWYKKNSNPVIRVRYTANGTRVTYAGLVAQGVTSHDALQMMLNPSTIVGT